MRKRGFIGGGGQQSTVFILKSKISRNDLANCCNQKVVIMFFKRVQLENIKHYILL